MKKDIYVFNGGRLSRKNDTLLLETDEGKRYIPVIDVESIHVFGEVDVNKSLLEFISTNGILMHYYNYYEYYVGSFYPREHLNSGYIILNQAKTYLEFHERIFLAKAFIKGAIKNIITVLQYYDRREKDLSKEIEGLKNFILDVDNKNSIEEIMAIEGNARQLYYQCFNKIIEEEYFNFIRRSKRPPEDAINSLISFGNSILYSVVLSQIYNTQLDPRIGYLHSTNERRFSLNLDVAEIFKPIIVDRAIFSVINKKIISKNDFEKSMGGILLKETSRIKFVKEIHEKLDTTLQLPNLEHRVSYKRLIRLELYKLQKHISEKVIYEPFVAKW